MAAIVGISVEEVQKKGLRAFLEQELRAIRTEILATCQKYGVRAWEGMNRLIVEDKIEEGAILEDFQRVDHLTAQAKQLQALLERV